MLPDREGLSLVIRVADSHILHFSHFTYLTCNRKIYGRRKRPFFPQWMFGSMLEGHHSLEGIETDM